MYLNKYGDNKYGILNHGSEDGLITIAGTRRQPLGKKDKIKSKP